MICFRPTDSIRYDASAPALIYQALVEFAGAAGVGTAFGLGCGATIRGAINRLGCGTGGGAWSTGGGCGSRRGLIAGGVGGGGSSVGGVATCITWYTIFGTI